MFAGHFATALAIKVIQPRASTARLVIGTGLLDLAFGTFFLAGIEGISTDGRLFVPYSHSLAGALIFALFYGLFGYRAGIWVAVALAASVLSHWILDLLVHGPDLVVWPGASHAYGFRNRFGTVSGFGEAIVTSAALALYVIAARRSTTFGRRWPVACAAVLAAYLAGLGIDQP